MAVPNDQETRQQRFTRDHPGWPVRVQHGATRVTAGKGGSRSAHIAAALSRELLDRLDETGDGR